MRHSIQAEGFGVRLRPVRLEDAGFIVWLRNQEHVRGRVGDSAPNVAAQEAWLKKYFDRAGDYYFIVETPGGISVGTHGLYDIQGTSAEKGRHIVRQDVMAGVPTGFVATDIGFEQLALTELRAHCVATNTAVRSLHRRTGFKELGVLPGAQNINGQPVDLIEFVLFRESWTAIRESLVPLAQLAGKQVFEWEKTQKGKGQPWL